MKVPLCFVKSSVECFIEVFARREVELLQYIHTDGNVSAPDPPFRQSVPWSALEGNKCQSLMNCS